MFFLPAFILDALSGVVLGRVRNQRAVSAIDCYWQRAAPFGITKPARNSSVKFRPGTPEQ
jgi:hypothetical protein